MRQFEAYVKKLMEEKAKTVIEFLKTKPTNISFVKIKEFWKLMNESILLHIKHYIWK